MATTQFSIKYRPRNWEDIYGQDASVKNLKTRILTGKIPKATLFIGPFGTGKTTMAEIFAAAIQAPLEDGNPDWNHPSCKSILKGTFDRDTQRLDGAQFSGKDDMTDFVKDLKMKPMMDKKKILIIEECDQLSKAAFNSLLKVLEDDIPHVHFILLSMEDKKGVPDAIKSRCQIYKVKPLDAKSTMMGLKHIMELENVWLDESIPKEFRLEGLKQIALLSKGSMRSAVQNLEKCLVSKWYTPEEIENGIGEIDEISTKNILRAIIDKTKDEKVWRQIMSLKGDDIMHFYNYSLMLLSEAMICALTDFAYDDWAHAELKAWGNNPDAIRLFNILSLHPQMAKDYIRNSDLLSALACYYRGDDFDPNNKITVTTGNIQKHNIIPGKNETPDIMLLNNPVQHLQEEKIVLGTKETPKFMEEPTNNDGVRVRTRKAAKKVVF